MRRQRWEHLDRDLKPPRPAAPLEAPQQTPPASHPVPDVSAAVLTRARGYFHLGHHHACIETLQDEDLSHDPDGAKLLGLALGYVADPRAVEVLQQAVKLSPGDTDLRASLLSARIRSGNLPLTLEPAPTGALGELSAAVLWLRGRGDLHRGNAAAAASAFTRATALFAAESPADARTLRVGTSYVSAAVSHLRAGDTDAAQNAFAAVARHAAPELASFANTLHALGEEIRGSSDVERAEALAPLVELVTSTQLHAGFYGRPGPVNLQWSGSDLVALTGYRR